MDSRERSAVDEMSLLFGKECNGQPRQRSWVTNGWLVMGKELDFGRITGFGNSSLAIQFWHLYVINNEQGATIS